MSNENLDFRKVHHRLSAVRENLLRYAKMLNDLDSQYYAKINELNANGLHVGAVADILSHSFYPATSKQINDVANLVHIHIKTIDQELDYYRRLTH